jgi:hypothetical protein
MKLTTHNLLVCLKALEYRYRDSGVNYKCKEMTDTWKLLRKAVKEGLLTPDFMEEYE